MPENDKPPIKIVQSPPKKEGDARKNQHPAPPVKPPVGPPPPPPPGPPKKSED